jgi:hypothetical protein
MEDVKELLEEGLPAEQIAIELDFSLDKVKQIISSLGNKKNKIYIPTEYSGVIMELGEEVDPNDIISFYNKIVEEGTPLVSYSQYGTEGKFYNEDDDEIPTDVILDELNYAIGLEDLDETFLIPKPVRKFNPFWKDEDIALEILKSLKSLKGNSEGIAKLLISEVRGYSFIVDGFKFHVKYGFRMGPGGGRYSGEMKMNDKYMEVSTEVCKQIFNLVEQLKNTDFIEQEEDDKKDFRINRGLM